MEEVAKSKVVTAQRGSGKRTVGQLPDNNQHASPPGRRWRQVQRALCALGLGVGLLLGDARAASVSLAGYTNAFSTIPSAGDWSTVSIGSGSGDYTSPAQLDLSATGTAANAIALALVADANEPPAANAAATYGPGGYVQTRPTGVGATLLMCTLLNASGSAAQSITVSYDFTKSLPVTEEIDGHRAFYSLSGASGSWVNIPELSTATPGRITATINLSWPANTPLYLMWADDNGSGTPDTVFQIDNFSVTLVSAVQVPASISSSPVSQAVNELQPATFTVGINGNPVPTVQWYTNNVAVAGATTTTLTIPTAYAAFNGMTVKAVAQNVANSVTYSATSGVAVLTVNADTTAPVLLGAVSSGLNLVVASFSERLDPVSITNVANYAINGTAGTLIISNAVLDASQTNVILTVSAMAPGTSYTLTVNNVADQSAAANRIANNSQAGFAAAVTSYADIGGASASTVSVAGNGYNISAAGTNILGVSDQFTFVYQTLAGNFDLKVRVAAFSGADIWARSGLMARETLAANSRFAASLASPGVASSVFEYRTTTGGAATTTGSYPPNYPYTWLRLVRSGDVFTGYAGQDGQTWVQLGTVTMAFPATAYVGLTTSSGSATQRASTQFRDYGSALGATVVLPSFTREPLDASSRKTGLVISEIMYHPKARADGRQVEFIELYNSRSIFENLSGWRLSGDVDFTFPTGTVMQAGTFLVLAKVAADVQSVYGISGVLQYGLTNYTTNEISGIITTNIGPSLNNGGGTVRLRNPAGAVVLEVNIGTKPPWPIEADGSGHSLVLARPSYGEADPRAWAASDLMGGSPGTYDSLGPEPARNIVINEFLANSSPASPGDYIELYNRGSTAVDISGFWLSDRADLNKFRIPNGTVLGPRSFVAFTESQFNPTPGFGSSFGLNSSGERIFLVNSNQNRVIDAVWFDAQGNDVSTGRYPDGAPTFSALVSRTPGTTNAPVLRGPIVINELMYNPISGDSDDEYIELYNRGATTVSLANWKFTDGISFTFPTNAVIAPGQYLVVAKNAIHLIPKYSNLNTNNTLGDYSGTLGNGGDRVALSMPDLAISTNDLGQFVTNIIHVEENVVTYGTGGRWADGWADGLGSSLELIDPQSDNSQPSNWADSDESRKGAWTSFEFTGLVDNQQTGQGNGDQIQIIPLGVGEYMIDDIEARWTNLNTLVNGNFETGTVGSYPTGWTPQGSMDQSFLDTNGFSGKALHILAMSRGDNGANRIRSPLSPAITGGTATLRAKARWIRGFPELLLRLRGGGLEAFGRLPVPGNLGTPGQANSRRVSNAGPAIYDVTHSPVLPPANTAVQVMARVTDPDGVSRLSVKYRVDPGATYATVSMVDNGTGGDAAANDGLFTGTIPAQPAGTLVAFYVEAVDGAGVTNIFPANATTRAFPNDAPGHECLVRWNEVQMPGSFATYHIWITAAVNSRWTNRDRLNNAPLDATFVYNNYRVVYNMKPQYAGSPWHNGSMTGPMSQGNRMDYVMQFSEGDRMLGARDFVLNTVGNPSGNTSSDLSGMAEQTSYEVFKGVGIHYNYRRYIHLFVDGDQRSITGNLPGNFIMEDSQQPNGDEIDEWYSNDTDGQLYKIEDWFEFADGATTFSNDDADLQRRATTYYDPILNKNVNALKLAPYRFMWRKRSLGAGDSANDYTNILSAIDIISPAASPAVSPIPDAILKQFAQVVDIEQWMHIFAVQHTIGNWDSYGYERGKNCYTYRPTHGKFQLMTWDIDFTVGVGGHGTTQSLFDVNDQRIASMNNTPETLRAYWRSFKEIVNGPFNNAYLDPLMDARARAFQGNNVNYDPNVVQTIKSFVAGRRTYITQQLATVSANFNVNATNIAAVSNLVVITGTAPVEVKTIEINGISYPITWTSTTGWSLRLPLSLSGTNRYAIQALDRFGNQVFNGASSVTISYPGIIEGPETNIVISEIMYNALVPGAEYVELYNRSTNTTFDLSGWQFNGLDYTFPDGAVIGPKSFLVLTKDRVSFANAYGGAVPVFDQFNGSLQNNGETISLVRPGATAASDLIITRARYDSEAPWPAGTDGTGSSLQLIDPTQGTARVGNWAAKYVPAVFSDPISTPPGTNDGWRFVQTNALFGSNNRLLIYLDNAGSVLLDDMALVAGTSPGVGFNYIRNGNFEAPLTTNDWIFGTNQLGSVIESANVHSGTGALLLVHDSPGSASIVSRDLQQFLAAPLPTNQLCNLSFWYWATNNSASTVSVRVVSSSLSVSTNIGVFIVPSNYVPAHVISEATNFLSPGATNTFSAAIVPAFPSLWINELQAENLSGPRDAATDRDPWIELYNSGTTPVSLDGLYLTSNYSNLTAWAFPSGYTVPAGGFRLIWCDGEPAETTATEIHTSFRLAAGSGSLALSRLYNGQPQVLDYINYSGLHADRSYGSYPDGQPFDRMEMYYITPGGTNDGRSAPLTVFINEWMASNTNYLADPADGKFDDWFEVYNPSTNIVDLAGYYFTDAFTNKFKYRVGTSGIHTIDPGGHLLVWADSDTGQNSSNRTDLHISFKLSKNGGTIALFAADGTQIDAVVYGAQAPNISEGRYPDGGPSIYAMTNPTPRAANVVGLSGGPNNPPVLDVIPPITVYMTETVHFTAHATDPDPGQTFTYSLQGAPSAATINPTTGAFSWSADAVSTNVFTVRVFDNGIPQLSDSKNVTIRVLSQPSVGSVQRNGSELTLTWATTAGRSYQIQYKDDLSPTVQWTNLGQPLTASSDKLSITDTVSLPRRFYRLVILP